MKAIIILGANLRLSPYAFFYIDALLSQKADITVVYWNRDGLPDVELDPQIKVKCFYAKIDNALPKTRKVKYFMHFRRFTGKLLRNQNYDLVVALDTQFAVLFSDILLKKYAGRFIYDMRDLSYEHIGIYQKRVAKIIAASSATFISSDGYRSVLPESDKIYTVHNICASDLKYANIAKSRANTSNPIRISFWGCIRDININKSLIDELKNDRRFQLNYYGTITAEAQQLIVYCKANNINNVSFMGSYLPSQKREFAEETDIIHNIYENAYSGKNPSMGNKYYDGIIFRIPQICLYGSYMGRCAMDEKIGICVEMDGHLADRVFRYYEMLGWKQFELQCNNALTKIISEQEVSNKALKRVIDHGNA